MVSQDKYRLSVVVWLQVTLEGMLAKDDLDCQADWRGEVQRVLEVLARLKEQGDAQGNGTTTDQEKL